jgi:hypothetical protein
MNADDMSASTQYLRNQLIGQYGLDLSDSEIDELVEHLLAFKRRAETIRRVRIEQSEEPALKLFVTSPGGSR